MAFFPPYIVVSGRKLRFYDKYDNHQEALRVAKSYQKKLRNNYFILHRMGSFGHQEHGLYMNKVYAIGFY